MELKKVLSVSAAAEALGVSSETVRKLYRKGRLEGYTIEKKIVLFEESLIDFQNKPKKSFPEMARFTKEENRPIQENIRSRKRKPMWERHL